MKNSLAHESSFCALLAMGLICGIASLYGEEASPAKDLLRFRNGDSLHGNFLGLKNGELHWRHSVTGLPSTND